MRFHAICLACLALLLMLNTASPARGEPSDSTIQNEIQATFARNALALGGVEVNVQDRVVLLSGNVGNEAQAQEALTKANSVPGVKKVVDKIDLSHRQADQTLFTREEEQEFKRWLKAIASSVMFQLSVLGFFIVFLLGALLLFLRLLSSIESKRQRRLWSAWGRSDSKSEEKEIEIEKDFSHQTTGEKSTIEIVEPECEHNPEAILHHESQAIIPISGICPAA